MRFSVQTGQENISWDELLDTWQLLEGLSYDAAWTTDHLLPAGAGDADGPCLEGWTTLAALAARVPRLRLGTMVTCNTFRNPAHLAKIATTVDVISGGRLNFGIGAGWFEREHAAYGFDFGTAGERFDRLEEALQVIRLLWSGEQGVSFRGDHYRLEDAPFVPAPVQQPHPPIWVGGAGPNRTLRLVAKYADAWNGNGTLELLADRIERLRRHCDDVGRRFEDIELTAAAALIPDAIYERFVERTAEWQGLASADVRRMTIGGSPEDLRSAVQAYADAGFTHLVMVVNTPYDRGLFERVAREVFPAFT